MNTSPNPSQSYALDAPDFGLLFYNARFYDPSLGRFASADTLIPDPGNPLDYDRYAYVRNNALKYTDPSGHVPVCDIYMDDGTTCAKWRNSNDSLSGKFWRQRLAGVTKDQYEVSEYNGKYFVELLKSQDGWWSKYMNDGPEMWMFLLGLIYYWETYSYAIFHRDDLEYRMLMDTAITNKFWDFYGKFGADGAYTYIGSMGTVRERNLAVGTNGKTLSSQMSIEKQEYYDSLSATSVDVIWSKKYYVDDVGVPYDWGNANNPNSFLWRSSDALNPQFIISWDMWR